MVKAADFSELPDGKAASQYKYLDVDNDVVFFSLSGAPVDGTSGTGAGIAGPGSLCSRYDASAKLYINTNTKASPTWIAVGTQI